MAVEVRGVAREAVPVAKAEVVKGTEQLEEDPGVVDLSVEETARVAVRVAEEKVGV